MKQLVTLCMKSESQKKWGIEFFFLFLFIPWPQPMWQWQLHPVSIFLPHRYIQRNVSSQVNNKDWPSQVDTNAFIYWKKSKIQNLCRSAPWNLDFYFFTHPSIILILCRIKYFPMHTKIELRQMNKRMNLSGPGPWKPEWGQEHLVLSTIWENIGSMELRVQRKGTNSLGS